MNAYNNTTGNNDDEFKTIYDEALVFINNNLVNDSTVGYEDALKVLMPDGDVPKYVQALDARANEFYDYITSKGLITKDNIHTIDLNSLEEYTQQAYELFLVENHKIALQEDTSFLQLSSSHNSE